MDLNKRLGFLALFGAAQFFLALLVCERLYPDFSVANNWISDLGVGSTELLFNGSLFVAALCGVACAALSYEKFKDHLFSGLILFASVAAGGIAVFNEEAGMLHTAFSLAFFVLGPLAAALAARIVKTRADQLTTVFIGGLSLLAAAMLVTGNTLWFGNGGMEHSIVLPFLAWEALGGVFMLRQKDAKNSKKRK